MPIKRPALVNDEIYHVVTRGVGDTLIFHDENDRYRGIFSLYEFNTTAPIEIRKRREHRRAVKARGEQLSADNRDILVEIWAFCFMSNHIHLLLKQVKSDGISQFMRKLGAGYAAYFNQKYKRKGHLFQGRFRAVHVNNDRQLKTVFVYIHSNPISLIEPQWKERKIKNSKKVIEFLENYKWMSYEDYIGKKNFPSVTNRTLLLEIMGGYDGCRDLMKGWIRYKEKLDFSHVQLE